jgi:hypothetical protein
MRNIISETVYVHFGVLGGTVETALSLQVLEPLMLLLEPSRVFCEFSQQAQCMYICLITFMHVKEVCLFDVLLLNGIHEM